MKTLLTTFSLATAFALAPFAGHLRAQDNSTPAPAQAPAQGDAVSFQTFYDQLANQGTWINSDKYGYVFQPTENDANWRPYTYGHWVNTDAGMTWVSDDSFGWATDHYGRWANLDGVGWVWVPGYTWAPAWVSWREGTDVADDSVSDNEVGWAPLPPDSDVGIDYYGDNDFGGFSLGFGFHIGNDCDTAYGIGPACYNFCPVAYIGDRDAWRHFRDRRDNFALIGHTRNVTNLNFRRDGAGRFGHVREEGPNLARLNERAHNRIETAQLSQVSGRNEAGLRGHTLGVFAPRVDRTTARSARPDVVAQNVGRAGVNRGTDINRPLAVNSHVAPAVATSEEIRAARVAQTHENSSAHVATANTHFSHAMTQPLTSFRTDTRTANNPAQTQRFNNASAPAQTPRTFASDSRFTGEPATATTREAVMPATGASFAGVSGQRHDVGAPTQPAVRRDSAFTGESRVTGEPSGQHALRQAEAPQTFTAHTAPGVNHESSFATGEANRPASVYHPSAATPIFHPQASAPTFHQSAPIYHPQASAPAFHPSAPAYHPQASAPSFHQSAPAYHPQASFHSAAPAPQMRAGGGGGFHAAAAPAAHAGGGGGGGAAHAAAAAPGGHR